MVAGCEFVYHRKYLKQRRVCSKPVTATGCGGGAMPRCWDMICCISCKHIPQLYVSVSYFRICCSPTVRWVCRHSEPVPCYRGRICRDKRPYQRSIGNWWYGAIKGYKYPTELSGGEQQRIVRPCATGTLQSNLPMTTGNLDAGDGFGGTVVHNPAFTVSVRWSAGYYDYAQITQPGIQKAATLS